MVAVAACVIAAFLLWKHHGLTSGLRFAEGELFNIQRESKLMESGAVRQYYRWIVEIENPAGEKQQIVLADKLTSLRPPSGKIAFYYDAEKPENAYLARGLYSLHMVFVFAAISLGGFIAFLAFMFERRGKT